MNDDMETVTDCLEKLISGWSERVRVGNGFMTQQHGSLLGQLHVAARMPSSGNGGPSCNPNKSGSRPPVNMAPLNLIEQIAEEAAALFSKLSLYCGEIAPRGVKRKLIDVLCNIRIMCRRISQTHPQLVHEAARAFSTWVRQARIMLNYESRMKLLADTSCGDCGGNLTVAEDASTDVRCVGNDVSGSCGRIYRRESWVMLI